MYELWLMLNILWEIALGVWPWLLAALVVWLVLITLSLRRGGAWSTAVRPALLIGVAALVIGFLAVPALTRSSLGELAYWVDWISLAGIAVGVGVAAMLAALPILQLLKGNRP
jgi:hypothetical protein